VLRGSIEGAVASMGRSIILGDSVNEVLFNTFVGGAMGALMGWLPQTRLSRTLVPEPSKGFLSTLTGVGLGMGVALIAFDAYDLPPFSVPLASSVFAAFSACSSGLPLGAAPRHS
jgi:hypothetical protein